MERATARARCGVTHLIGPMRPMLPTSYLLYCSDCGVHIRRMCTLLSRAIKEAPMEDTHTPVVPLDLTEAIAREINATRRRMPVKHKRDTETALNILAMKVAGHIAQCDPRFSVATFATNAGIDGKPQHLVTGEYLD